MSNLRSKFEEIPEIKIILGCDDILWDDVYNWYRTNNTDANSTYHLAWLNGAWFVFQEQQRKIDALIKIVKCGSLEDAQSLIYTYIGYDHYYDKELNDAVIVVEGLLND